LELAQAAEWVALQEAKENLDTQREKLAEMRQMVAAAPEEDAAEEDAAEEATEEAVEGEVEAAAMPTAEDVETLENTIAAATEDFGGRLVNFLNNDPMIEGEPPTERQLAALHMKSEEDIVLAQEWIEKGGDYKRAIDIYNNSLRIDPDNEAVKAALAEAEAMRYMSQERFTAAKKGMSEAEVREALGQVNLHNIKSFPDRKVIAWFYPTADNGAAAAVWFREEKSGNKVYRLNFEEVKPKEQQEAG
jgi:hypothetical protein